MLWTQLRKSAQMKRPFYVLRAHRSILYNQVDVDGHSSSGRFCSHHIVAPWMLLISGCQQCAVVVPTAGKNICLRHAWFEYERDNKQWEMVTFALQLLAQRG